MSRLLRLLREPSPSPGSRGNRKSWESHRRSLSDSGSALSQLCLPDKDPPSYEEAADEPLRYQKQQKRQRSSKIISTEDGFLGSKIYLCD